MNKVNGIKFLFFSRGFSKWARRLISIQRRFSFFPFKQMNIIRQYADCLRVHEVQGTFFIPAVLLDRYVTHLRTISPEIIEWGIHGFVHTDHSKLQYEQQKTQITKAVGIFERHGFSFKGFRCPYLRFNEHTKRILMETGCFQFDSSDSIIWEEVYGDGHKHSQWIRDFYQPQPYRKNLARPYRIEQLIEIPVSLPDDDIMIDREQMKAAEILHVWSTMLSICHRSREVMVLQLHPERFLELKEVLMQLIKEAKSLKPAIWITTLGEVSGWQKNNPPGTWPEPYQSAFCITGDIDAITIQDFFTRLVEW